jgi:ADP-ribosylation factor protein 1
MLLSEELQKACLLVYANKQDVSSAVSPSQLTEKMNLSSLKNRRWLVQGASAIKGEGLLEGLDWVAKQLTSKSKST